jgi:oxaloacetate decarboxylase gamma subunit
MTMELFRQAVTIMVLGMGLVFVFLALVILLVQATAALIRRHEAKPGSGGQDPAAGGDGERVAAVIAVALHEQR